MGYVEAFDGTILGTLLNVWTTLLATSSRVIAFLYSEFSIPFLGSFSVFEIMFGTGLVAFCTYKIIQQFTPL